MGTKRRTDRYTLKADCLAALRQIDRHRKRLIDLLEVVNSKLLLTYGDYVDAECELEAIAESLEGLHRITQSWRGGCLRRRLKLYAHKEDM